MNQVVDKYENIILADNLNTNLLDSKSDPNNFFSFLRDMYDLANLVKGPICYKSLKDTLLHVLLTNKPNSIQKTIVCKAGLNDWHMLIATTLRSTFIKLSRKTVKYRSYKNFNETTFLQELDEKLIQGDLYCSVDPYFKLTEIFSSILNNMLQSNLYKLEETKLILWIIP